MKKKVIIAALIITFLNSGLSYAVGINWHADSTPHYLRDEDGAILSVGNLVQFILDADGDGIDSIEFTGSYLPTGGDILMPLTTGNSNTIYVGDNCDPSPTAPGHFKANSGFDASYVGSNVYIRFWNAVSPGVGDYYGESTNLYTLANNNLQVFNILERQDIAFSGDLSTNTQLIPEPSSLFLFSSGLIGLLFTFYRKKK